MEDQKGWVNVYHKVDASFISGTPFRSKRQADMFAGYGRAACVNLSDIHTVPVNMQRHLAAQYLNKTGLSNIIHEVA